MSQMSPLLADVVTPFVLAVLKYAFLALLYFFVYRSIRALAAEVTGRPGRVTSGPSRTVETRPIKPSRGGRGKAPTTLVVRSEDGKKAGQFPLRDPVQIGRAEACHVRIDDMYSSQYHARLFPRNGAWFVEDLGSTNGTYLNRQRLQGAAEVQAGDRIKIGKTTMELKR
jgi:FHA domain